jgi:hypothetical protein
MNANNHSRRRQGAGAQSDRMPAMCAEVGGLRNDEGAWDLLALRYLADRLSKRGTRLRRDEIAKRLSRLGSLTVRDWRWVAWRWLRRYVGGSWTLGGHHVARPYFGPMLYAGERGLWSNLLDDGEMVTLKVNERESAAGERRAA